MKTFCCFACRRHKKTELVGEIRPNKQKICTSCVTAKDEARKRLAQEYGINTGNELK